MKLLFVHNHLASFVAQDLDCLRARYSVTERHIRSKWLSPIALWREIAAHDLVFGWFASWHTFLPMLFARCLGKPSLLVVGGYDLANLPEIGYGHQRGGLKKWISRATIRLARTVVTNSNYSKGEARDNAGIRKHLTVIHHGVPDLFGTVLSPRREPMVLTIGNVDRANLQRKGLAPFVRAAALLPHIRFVVVGAWKDDAIYDLRAIATPNVEFSGWVDDASLLEYCRSASVYVQASQHEGFGMSVAEAMLAGCIPVVTRLGALPEVVGDCGVYTSSAKPAHLAEAIEKALGLPEESRQNARQRILTHFSPDRRHAAIEQVISTLLVDSQPFTKGVPTEALYK